MQASRHLLVSTVGRVSGWDLTSSLGAGPTFTYDFALGSPQHMHTKPRSSFLHEPGGLFPTRVPDNHF